MATEYPMVRSSQYEELLEREREAATRFVASQATDAEDARLLLQCLGLIPDPSSKPVT